MGRTVLSFHGTPDAVTAQRVSTERGFEGQRAGSALPDDACIRNAIPDSTALKRASIGAALFDSAHGARICHECRQIIQFGKDGSYSKGLSTFLYVRTIVSR